MSNRYSSHAKLRMSPTTPITPAMAVTAAIVGGSAEATIVGRIGVSMLSRTARYVLTAKNAISPTNAIERNPYIQITPVFAEYCGIPQVL